MSSFYDSFDYPAYWQTRLYEDGSECMALTQLFKEINASGKMVDLGGGYGRLANLYSQFFTDCLVIEPSIDLINIGRKRMTDLKRDNVSFRQGSLPRISFLKSNLFDVALMIRVIHHINDVQPSLKEAARILKKDGYLIIEIANKIHFLARIKEYLSGNFRFTKDFSPVDRRSPKSIRENKIFFINHHPEKIKQELEKLGFTIIDQLSVSNFRSEFLKKMFPLKFLLFLEIIFQRPLAGKYFGPSIFFLAKKK